MPPTSIRQLWAAAHASLLDAIAVAAQRACEGYPTEKVGELYEQECGLRLARGILQEEDLDLATGEPELRDALRILRVCRLTLIGSGHEHRAAGMERLRHAIAKELGG